MEEVEATAWTTTQSIDLGRRYRDRATKFEGVATGMTIYLNGCVHLQLEGEVTSSDVKELPIQSLDEARCEPLDVPEGFAVRHAPAMGVELGKKYRDPISGFEGIAVAWHAYYTGYVHVSLEGDYNRSEDKLPWHSYDEARLVRVTPERRQEPVTSSASRGGPARSPQSTRF